VLLLSSQLSLAVGATKGLQWDHYHNQDQLEDAFRQINGKCPDISVLYSIGQSVEGRELVVMHFSTTPGQHIPLKPEVKYIGGIHGNEPSGRELLIRLADHLCEGYLKKDSEVMTLLNSTSIHLLPAMNPDGFELALNTEPAERKWLTGRTNAMNVDLNRDFPDLDGVFFELDSMKVPKFDHLLDLFRDDQPRQPETLAVGNWILSLPWVISANLHEGDLVANYPFDASSKEGVSQYSASPDDTTFKWLAQTYAKNHAHMGMNDHPPCDGTKEDAFSRNGGITNGAKWYSVVGGMQDFNYLATNAMEITLELSCEKMVDGKQLPQFWEDNKKALMAYMFTAHAGVKGQIFDDETGLPVQHAALWVRNGSQTEPIRHPVTSWEDGDYYRVLPPGQYELLVDADGYETASQNVTVTNQARDQALIVNFGLKPIKVPNLEGEGPSDEELAEILSEMRQ
jgi:hypothetical protein